MRSVSVELAVECSAMQTVELATQPFMGEMVAHLPECIAPSHGLTTFPQPVPDRVAFSKGHGANSSSLSPSTAIYWSHSPQEKGWYLLIWDRDPWNIKRLSLIRVRNKVKTAKSTSKAMVRRGLAVSQSTLGYRGCRLSQAAYLE